MAELLEQIKHLSRREQLTLLREIAHLLEDETFMEEGERERILRAEEAFQTDKNKGEEWDVVRERILSATPRAEPIAA